MNAKLAALWAKAQAMLSQVSWPSAGFGIAVGYLGHPFIKLALEAAGKLIKLI